MPDDRLIHAAFGQSEKINQLTAYERDVWLIYKLAADDFGVMRLAAAPLQNVARWFENEPAKRLLRALERVRDVGLVREFDHQGQMFVFDPAWQTWQKITHPRQTKQPAPPADVLDANTRWLFHHHPNGGKLSSWKAPRKDRDETGNKPELDLEKTGNKPEVKPESTRPVLVGSGGVGVGVSGGGEAAAAGVFAEHRSKRPIFKGQSFVVFEWQLDDLRRMLGAHTNDFDLHQWFSDLDVRVSAAALIVPQRDGGKWLQEQTLAEAIRRGLPVAQSAAAPVGKTAGNTAAAARFVARGRR